MVNFKNLPGKFGFIPSSGNLKLQGSGSIKKTVTFSKPSEQLCSKIFIDRQSNDPRKQNDTLCMKGKAMCELI